jgi:hypothetical protein
MIEGRDVVRVEDALCHVGHLILSGRHRDTGAGCFAAIGLSRDAAAAADSHADRVGLPARAPVVSAGGRRSTAVKNSSFRVRFANARARIGFDYPACAAQSKWIRTEPGGNRPARSIVDGACAAKGGWIGGQDRAGSRDALAYRPPSFRSFRALDRGRNDEGDPVTESPSRLLPGPGIAPGVPLPQCGRPDSFTACRNHFG